jgi:hypothetical protein
MEDIDWLDEWEAAVAKLAHSTLLLLAEGEAKSKFELGRFAAKHSAARVGVSSEDSSLLTPKVANVALVHLQKTGFVIENQKKFEISAKGLNAIERYPDVFSSLFVKRELLSSS